MQSPEWDCLNTPTGFLGRLFDARLLTSFGVPGVAIGLTVGQEGVRAGYGWGDLRRRTPMTGQSLFVLASITKAFTVTALGTMVDEGILDWDEPVRTYLPRLKLVDPAATEHLTLRDIVAHRSGLPRHHFAWYLAPVCSDEIIGRLSALQPTSAFRTKFHYNSLLYIIANHLMAAAAGRTWQVVIRDRVLNPLGMRGSCFASQICSTAPDLAIGYDVAPGSRRFRRLPITTSPVSDWVVSSVFDLMNFVACHASCGVSSHGRLLAPSTAVAIQTPQIVIQASQRYPEIGEMSYGLGFFIYNYRNQKLVEHTGKVHGHSTFIGFLPQHRFGIIVFANREESALPRVIAFNAIDAFLGLNPVPWAQRLLLEEKKPKTQASEQGLLHLAFEGPPRPRRHLDLYCGLFTNAGYGCVRVLMRRRALVLSINGSTWKLQHVSGDVFRFPITNGTDRFVTFVFGASCVPNYLTIPFETAIDPLRFERISPDGLKSRP